MKKYKFVCGSFPDNLSKEVNKYIRKGWLLREWKPNDNTIIVLLEKEKNNE